METTDFRDRDDWSGRYSAGWTMIRRVFLEAEMRSGPMVVPDVRGEDAPKMRLVDDDDVVETLASDGSDQAFYERILPRTRWS
jgi:hypothetical protein